MKRIAELLTDASTNYPNRLAIIDGDKTVTYNQLSGYISELEDVLKTAGCCTGVSVGLFLPNGVEYLASFFAISKGGGTIVPISSGSTDDEIIKIINRCNISIMICDKMSEFREFINYIPNLILVEEVDGRRLSIETVLSGSVILENDLVDIALLLGTSGSTGKSKFVMLTDKNLIINVRSYLKAMEFQGTQKVYCILPMYHIYSISAQILAHIFRGDELYVFRPPFMVEDFLETVQEYKINVTSFVPYMTNMLANFTKSADFNTSSLKVVTIAGAKASAKVIQSLNTNYPNTRFLPTYGLTEASPRVSLARPYDKHFPAASAGHPLPGVEVRIDSTDHPDKMIGEVLVKSQGVMKGYYKNLQATNDAFNDGWLRTGDIGFIDESNYLHIVGRKKNLIISGGMNIYPPEIEDCLREHDSVIDAAVVALKHDLLQEVPFAFVESSDIEDAKLISELRSICMRNLSLYKVPYDFVCMKKIPRLANSKVDYSRLKELANGIN